MRAPEQISQVNKMAVEIIKGKLKLGQLLRSVRSQDWSKIDRNEWEAIQQLAKSGLINLPYEQARYIRSHVARNESVATPDVSEQLPLPKRRKKGMMKFGLDMLRVSQRRFDPNAQKGIEKRDYLE